MSEQQSKNSDERPRATDYLIALFSFIPLLGLLLGFAAIILGIRKFAQGGWIVALIGLGGIATTIGLYGYLALQMFNPSGPMLEAQTKFSQMALNDIVRDIEFYKLTHGSYPKSIDELKSDLSKFTFTQTIDFSDAFKFNKKQPRDYYYRLSDDGQHYAALGLGPDNLPFTADDILPSLPADQLAKTGFVLKLP